MRTCILLSSSFCTRQPFASSAAGATRSAHGKVPQSRARSALHLSIVATEKEKDGVERVATNRPDLLLRNLGEGKGGTALQVDIVRE